MQQFGNDCHIVFFYCLNIWNQLWMVLNIEHWFPSCGTWRSNSSKTLNFNLLQESNWLAQPKISALFIWKPLETFDPSILAVLRKHLMQMYCHFSEQHIRLNFNCPWEISLWKCESLYYHHNLSEVKIIKRHLKIIFSSLWISLPVNISCLFFSKQSH